MYVSKPGKHLFAPTHGSIAEALWANKTGVSMARMSKYDQALDLFYESLQLLAQRPYPPLLSMTRKPSLYSRRAARRDDLPSSKYAADETTLSSDNKKAQSQYDEGMNFVRDYFENMDYSLDEATMAAAVLYNIGQVRLCQERFHDARHCFFETWHLCNVGSCLVEEICVCCLYNIACSEYYLGKYETAKKALLDTERYCGTLQGATQFSLSATTAKAVAAYILNGLGVISYHLSDFSKALTYLSQASGMALVPQTFRATLLNNLGRVNFVLRRFDSAIKCYQEGILVRVSFGMDTGIDHAAVLCNLAQAQERVGNLDVALENFQQFLNHATPILGNNHQDIIFVRKCLASVHCQRDEKEMAVIEYKKILASLIGSGKRLDSEMASIFSRIGKLCTELGDHETALNMYSQGLNIECQIYEQDHPNIIITLSNMAQICQFLGDNSTALCFYSRVLEAQTNTLGRCNGPVAETISRMGLLNYQDGEYDSALDLYRTALAIRRYLNEGEGLEIACSLNSIALVLFKLGFYGEAMQNFSECLRIRQEALGHMHHDVAVVLYNIAAVQIELGDDEAGLSLYKESLYVEEMTLGPTHRDVVLCLDAIAGVYSNRGELREALGYHERVRDIQTQVSIDEIGASVTLNRIANLHLQLGETSEALRAVTKAARIAQKCDRKDADIGLSGFHLYSISKLFPEGPAAA